MPKRDQRWATSRVKEEECEEMSRGREWRPIQGQEGRYSVSKDGLVRSELKTTIRGNGRPITTYPRILKLQKDTQGYYQAYVFPGIGRKGRPSLVHRLVFEAWARPLEPGEHVDHKDNNPLNNHTDNLQAVFPNDHAKLTMQRIKERAFQEGWSAAVEYIKKL